MPRCDSSASSIPLFVVLASLAETYVQAINSGDVPSLENAVQVLAEMENAAAVRVAVSLYKKLMEERLVSKLPTETLEELLGVHAACEKEAIEKFMARAFGPKNKIEPFQINLVVCFVQASRKIPHTPVPTLPRYASEKKQFCAMGEICKLLLVGFTAIHSFWYP